MDVLQGGVVSTSPNPQAGGPPLVGCPRLFIQFIRRYPPYRRPFLYLQPEDAPCHGDRDLLHGNSMNCNNKRRSQINVMFFKDMLSDSLFLLYSTVKPVRLATLVKSVTCKNWPHFHRTVRFLIHHQYPITWPPVYLESWSQFHI